MNTDNGIHDIAVIRFLIDVPFYGVKQLVNNIAEFFLEVLFLLSNEYILTQPICKFQLTGST